MDQVTKIITAIGAVIAVVCAVGIITSFNKFRSGMANDNSNETDKGVQGMIVNGIGIVAGSALAATAIMYLSKIQF